jgi:UDP-4-amino-4,6-dideoxy-N-acetyl-beta-L-altrosamine N-acetyltransferase
MYTRHKISRAEHDAWFDAMLADPTKLYWKIMVSGRPSGVVHLTAIDMEQQRCEWGIYLATARGLGAGLAASVLSLEHAFERLAVRRVVCEAIAHNSQAIGLYRRIGFHCEGRLRAHVRREDEALDVAIFGLLRSDWCVVGGALRAGLVERGALEVTAS